MELIEAVDCVEIQSCSGSHAVEEVIAIENGGPSSSKGPNSLKELADIRANGADPIAAVIPRGAVLIRDVRLCEP